MFVIRLDFYPLPISQALLWPVAGFISHFFALRDPIAQVEKGQVSSFALFNLPKDGEYSGAQV